MVFFLHNRYDFICLTEIFLSYLPNENQSNCLGMGTIPGGKDFSQKKLSIRLTFCFSFDVSVVLLSVTKQTLNHTKLKTRQEIVSEETEYEHSENYL